MPETAQNVEIEIATNLENVYAMVERAIGKPEVTAKEYGALQALRLLLDDGLRMSRLLVDERRTPNSV